MQCPSCSAENGDEVTRCAKCGGTLSRRRRRNAVEDTDTPFSRYIDPANRPAVRAYRLAVLSMVPGLGLVLGPAALVLGAAARRRGKADPDFTARGPAAAAVLFGALTAVTNWAGLALMVAALR
ncbi:MAG TPA: hypothetical protein VFE78_08370 [Gemmataceae bacterium]|jgi:hypothetical protein|nr:hypothetical protein [Gemmataceae bacterium]